MQIWGFDRSTTQQACIKHTPTFLQILFCTVTTVFEHQQEIWAVLMVRNICLSTANCFWICLGLKKWVNTDYCTSCLGCCSKLYRKFTLQQVTTFKTRKFSLKWSKVRSSSALRKGQESWGWSAWRRLQETTEPLPVRKRAPRELERDLAQGPGVIGQDRMASHCQRAELDLVLGRNSLFGGRWGILSGYWWKPAGPVFSEHCIRSYFLAARIGSVTSCSHSPLLGLQKDLLYYNIENVLCTT